MYIHRLHRHFKFLADCKITRSFKVNTYWPFPLNLIPMFHKKEKELCLYPSYETFAFRYRYIYIYVKSIYLCMYRCTVSVYRVPF